MVYNVQNTFAMGYVYVMYFSYPHHMNIVLVILVVVIICAFYSSYRLTISWLSASQPVLLPIPLLTFLIQMCKPKPTILLCLHVIPP